MPGRQPAIAPGQPQAQNPVEASAAPRHLSAIRLREALQSFRGTNTALAFALLTFDVLLFAAGQALLLWSGQLASSLAAAVGMLAGGLVTWVAIVRLFVIGHDACHGALTGSDRLNRILGRIAFLPSMTPFSLWRVGHNVVHHGFNNMKGRDFVWEPHTPAEFAAMPRWRQRVERLYRSVLGAPVYYFVEIWWQRLYFPARRFLNTRRFEFTADSTLATVFGATWIAGLVFASKSLGTPLLATLLCGFALPFLLWNWTVGLIVYLHHTHPGERWYDSKSEWIKACAQVTSTVHLVMPKPFGALLHNIMEHPAHHLDASIPLYQLKRAQQRLVELTGSSGGVRFTLKHYLECVRACKLYDYELRRWVRFPAT